MVIPSGYIHYKYSLAGNFYMCRERSFVFLSHERTMMRIVNASGLVTKHSDPYISVLNSSPHSEYAALLFKLNVYGVKMEYAIK